MKILAHGFYTAAQYSNPGSRRRESEALPLSHYALQIVHVCNLKRRLCGLSDETSTVELLKFLSGSTSSSVTWVQ